MQDKTTTKGGRNFGLKCGVPIQEENETLKASRRRDWKWHIHSYPIKGRGRNVRRSPLLTAIDSNVRSLNVYFLCFPVGLYISYLSQASWKVSGTVPQSKNGVSITTTLPYIPDLSCSACACIGYNTSWTAVDSLLIHSHTHRLVRRLQWKMNVWRMERGLTACRYGW